MIYTCAKCKFLFERKNEPSKCPSCEHQCIVEANRSEQRSYKQLISNRGAVPFPDGTKNSGFGHGRSAGCVTNTFNSAVQNDVNANKQKGLPIAKYDVVKKRAYFEMPDGTREYINGS